MSSPRGTKRGIAEETAQEPEEPEDALSSDGSGDGEEPFGEGPASDLFSPSKEGKPRPMLPPRVTYVDRPMIIAGQLLDSAILCTLPHPRTGKAKYFAQKGSLLELHQMRREPGSWFAGDAVIEDGTLYMATNVDPLFVLIPMLEKSRKKDEAREGFFTPLEQLLAEDDQFTAGFHHAQTLGLLTGVHMLCDHRMLDNHKLYRLNDAKLLAWLEVKVVTLASRLMDMDSTVSQSAAVAANVNLARATLTQAEANEAAISMLSEYVSADWIRRVCTSLSISEPTTAKPPSAYLTVEAKSCRRGSEKETVVKPKPPAAIRRLESVDKRGMSAITSFFKPKPKPPSST